MKHRRSFFDTLLNPLLICLLGVVFTVSGHSQTNGLGSQRANAVENKRMEKQMWSQPQSNSLMNQRFPIEQWDKHFSPVGRKRAPIELKDGKDKVLFKTRKLNRKEVNFEMSRWNREMAGLHKKAGIEMDDRAQLVADEQLYRMVTQGSEHFSELEQKLSLRDLNRYQFRRNRPDGAIPVDRAGSGQ